jgi:hypothetical protein
MGRYGKYSEPKDRVAKAMSIGDGIVRCHLPVTVEVKWNPMYYRIW